jgi:tetratricopeptide (TPR) repeat protein
VVDRSTPFPLARVPFGFTTAHGLVAWAPLLPWLPVAPKAPPEPPAAACRPGRRQLRRSLNPSSMPAHARCGILLISLGRFSEAVHETAAATMLDPLFRQIAYWHARALSFRGDFGKALQILEAVRDRNPTDQNPHIHLAAFYVERGRLDDARREVTLAGGEIAGGPLAVFRAEVLAVVGDPSEARAIVTAWEEQSGSEHVRRSHIAALYVVLGDKERALSLLEEDAERGEQSFWIDFRRAVFDPIREESRFKAMLRAMKLPAQDSRASDEGASPGVPRRPVGEVAREPQCGAILFQGGRDWLRPERRKG